MLVYVRECKPSLRFKNPFLYFLAKAKVLQAQKDSLRANLNCKPQLPSLFIKGVFMLIWRSIVLSNSCSTEYLYPELELDLSG